MTNKKTDEYHKDNKPLKDWITKMYSKKCSDFDASCANCQAWKCYEQLRLK